MARLPGTKRLLLSSGILLVPVLLTCSGICQGQTSVTDQIVQLDPTSILFHNAPIENVHKAAESTDRDYTDDTIAASEIKPTIYESPNTTPQTLLNDEEPLFFSIINSQDRQQGKNTESDSHPQQETAETEHTASEEPQSIPKDELLKTSISSVAADPDNPNRQVLNDLIKQISSVKLRPKPKKSQPKSQPQDESKKPVDEIKKPAEPAANQPPPEQIYQQQSTQTLNPEIVQRLEEIIKRSGTTSEPQLLADMLYQTGHYDLASYFYELAISRDEDEVDKTWLMMQNAVCLRDSNPQEALLIYKSLTSQYPASVWVELAENRRSLIDWLETQQPKKLIEQCKQDLQTN